MRNTTQSLRNRLASSYHEESMKRSLLQAFPLSEISTMAHPEIARELWTGLQVMVRNEEGKSMPTTSPLHRSARSPLCKEND